MNIFNLDDVVVRVMEGDGSLNIPSPSELEGLEVGDYAKLIFIFNGEKRERMWVRITENAFPFFKGVLDNEPIHSSDLKLGELIEFEAQNVVDIVAP